MKNLLIVFCVLLSSCSSWRGAQYHLRKSKEHLLIAQSKGAVIHADTIYKNISVPQVRVDTVINDVPIEKLLRDTIYIEQNNQRIKIKYVEKEKRIYVKSNPVKPKIIRVPVSVDSPIIQTGLSMWEVIILLIVVSVISFTIGYKIKEGKK